MTDVPFHATRMGVRFYEHTVPELTRQLERLTAVLERIAESLERKDKTDDPQDRDQEGTNPPQRG